MSPTLLTYSPFPCLNQSTTTLKPLMLVGAVITGQWCVAGLSVLAHTHTPPADSSTLTWEGKGKRPHSSLFPHAESWGSRFLAFTIFLCMCHSHFGLCGFSITIGVPQHFILMHRLGIHLHTDCFYFLMQPRSRLLFLSP